MGAGDHFEGIYGGEAPAAAVRRVPASHSFELKGVPSIPKVLKSEKPQTTENPVDSLTPDLKKQGGLNTSNDASLEENLRKSGIASVEPKQRDIDFA